MSLPTLNLFEPLANAMVALLKANLNPTIDSLNATITDAYKVPHAAQILNYTPVPSTLQGGMPVVGIQEFPGDFEDDLQFSLHAQYRYAVIAIIQHVDHQTLVLQLRRMMQAIGATIQSDRMLGTANGSGGIMRVQGGAWSVQFVSTIPGPVLGDLDPNNPEAPPRSYLSWAGLELSSRREEI